MTHEEKLQSKPPEDTTDHARLDQLNRELADKLAQFPSSELGVRDLAADRERARLLLAQMAGDMGKHEVVNSDSTTNP